MATILVQTLVSQVRVDSDLNSSLIYDDTGIAGLLSDAGSDLYDVFSATNQKYNLSTFDFTLTGGVGGNSASLPADFQQGHSVDINPTSSNPQTLRYLSNWLERNRAGGGPWAGPGGSRCYAFIDAKLTVFPATAAAGTYRLYYTPQWTPLMIPQAVPASGVTPASINAIGVGGGGLSAVTFNNAAWTQASVGDSLVIANSANGNNGSYVIATVADNANIIVTGTLHAESATPVTATVQPQGTRPDLPTQMNPWVLYLKTIACITIRNKRGQDVASFEGRLAVLKDRIQTILQERQEEPTSPPWTRRGGSDFWNS